MIIRLPGVRKTRTFKKTAHWVECGGKRFYARSLWEGRYAHYLQFLKEKGLIKDWEHEPKTFWFVGIKRGTVSYLPDFRITRSDDSHCYVEVKGYYDAKSLTKIKRFRKYYPEEKLDVIDSEWFRKNNHNLRTVLKNYPGDI